MGTFPDSVVEAAWKRSGSRCECTYDHSWHKGRRCSQTLKKEHRGDDSKETGWEAHHKVSQDDGGSDELENCLIICIRCHNEIHSD